MFDEKVFARLSGREEFVDALGEDWIIKLVGILEALVAARVGLVAKLS